MMIINIKAEAYYSGAVVESSYIVTDKFGEFLRDGYALTGLSVHELDGKHSETDADVYYDKEENSINYDFTEDYFDDYLQERIGEEIDELEEDEYKELLSSMSVEERILIKSYKKRDWNAFSTFRSYQEFLAQKLFKVPEDYVKNIQDKFNNEFDEFVKEAYVKGLYR